MERRDFFKRLSIAGVGVVMFPGISIKQEEEKRKTIQNLTAHTETHHPLLKGNIELFAGSRYLESEPIAVGEYFHMVHEYPKISLGNGNMVSGARETSIMIHDPEVVSNIDKYLEFPNHKIHFKAEVNRGDINKWEGWKNRIIGRGFIAWLSEDELYFIVNEYHES